MADGTSMDLTQVNRLVTDLGRIPGRVVPEVREIAERGALNVKNRMVADARGSRHFKQIAPTISYDESTRAGLVSFDIGPDRSRDDAAKIANIAYFGGRNGGGGTLDIEAGLVEEGPRLASHLERLARGLL